MKVIARLLFTFYLSLFTYPSIARDESENSILNDLSKVDNSRGQRDNLQIEKDTFDTTEAITTETRVRFWVNKNELNDKANSNKTVSEKQESNLDEKADKNDTGKPEKRNSNDGEKLEYECGKSDFDSQEGTISKETITCRIKYKSYADKLKNIVRPEADRIALKERMEVANSIRKQALKDPTTLEGIKRGDLQKRTTGFAVIKNITQNKIDIPPLKIDIKAISGEDSIKKFAKVPTPPNPNNDPNFTFKLDDNFNSNGYYPTYYYRENSYNEPNSRVFRTQVIELKSNGNTIYSFRGNDAEVKLLEELADKYYKDINKRQNLEIEIFTDRETCQGCNTLIQRINDGEEQTKHLFKINPIEQGIFHTLTILNPERFTEKIAIKDEGFFIDQVIEGNVN